ncbi:MAG: hypothetical protein FJY77_04850 [Candidatus Altiarchaeales archaeon]|nr:hypothetical protein [Candidatus Altiarchaeales archaeon]
MDSTIERRRVRDTKPGEKPDLHEKIDVVPAGGLPRRDFLAVAGALLAGLASCTPIGKGVRLARDLVHAPGTEAAVQEGKTIFGRVIEDVDYGKILAGKQVLVIGDTTHTMPENVEELAVNVKQFRKNGVTHIALEALKSIHQKEVDAFLAGKISDQEMASIIKADWHSPRAQEPYLRLLKACRKGIKVVALDIPDRNVNSVEGYPGMPTSVARNYVWANRIMQALGEKRQDGRKPKIVVFGGTSHTQDFKYERTVTQLLRGEKVEVESAVIVIGDPRELDGLQQKIYGRSIELGLSEKRFMAPGWSAIAHNRVIYVPSRFQEHLEMQLRKDEKTLRDENSSPLLLQSDLSMIKNPEKIPGFLERMSRLLKDTSIPAENRVAIVKGLGLKDSLADSRLWQNALKHAAEHDPDSRVREAAKQAVKYMQDR